MIEKNVFLLTESWIENKNCSRIFGEHLAAIFRGCSNFAPLDVFIMLR